MPTTNQPNASTTANPKPVAPTTSVQPPDPSVVPVPPPGFVPPNKGDFRGLRPKKAELASVPDAILELQGFQDHAGIFGKTAPPADQVVG